MSELANYSIETDHTILLSFKDGRNLRVPIGQLGRHLNSLDLEKVQAAMKLRRDFIRDHMPKAVLVLAAGGLLALFLTGGREVARLIHPSTPTPATPEHTGIVRSFNPPTPAVSPAAQPQVQGDSTVAVASKHSSRVKPHPLPSVPPAAVTAAVIISASIPAPAPASNPVTASAQPSPAPTPSPTPDPTLLPPAPDQGQVLGDSTGPSPSPAP